MELLGVAADLDGGLAEFDGGIEFPHVEQRRLWDRNGVVELTEVEIKGIVIDIDMLNVEGQGNRYQALCRIGDK